MKTISILLAIFINPFVTWFMFIPSTTRDSAADWEWMVSLEIKVVAGILATAIAVLTFLNSTQTTHAKSAELLLIISGVGSLLWGVHLLDGWMMFCGFCLLTQGIAAIGSVENTATAS